MSDEAPEEFSKTEDPSHKRLEDAHQKGDVAKSQEVTTWFMLGGSAVVFAMLGPSTSANLMLSLKTMIANADQFEIGGAALTALWWSIAGAILMISLIPSIILAACAIVANVIQHRPLLSLDPITPKFERISPMAGAKRLFSTESLVNFVKGLVKLGIVGAAIFYVLWPERDRLDTMMTLDPMLILENFNELGLKIFFASMAAVTVVAGADLFYQRQKWWKRHKMTLQETKDEYKQMEGDPKIKGRLRQLRQERGRQRMMQAVPDATVIITNPTHYAVALKYDRQMAAPLCVAKGADDVALRIREMAKKHDVPIVENPPLARSLYASVDIDETIPTEHFKAVAQVIGFVMRLKNKRSWKSSSPSN
jgi:flagellar biosynthetic protein FlhB